MRRSTVLYQCAALLWICSAALFAQPKPAGLPLASVRSGQALFHDNGGFAFDEVPAALSGLGYARGSLRGGVDFVVEGTGYVYVITPRAGIANSQADVMVRQGFTEVPFVYSRRLWTRFPTGLELSMFERRVQGGERVVFGGWGIPLFTATSIRESRAMDTDKSQVAPVGGDAVLPVSRTDAWWLPRHEAKLAEVRAGGIELVLLGDSITQRWEEGGAEVYAGLTTRFRTLNLGFSGDRTQHVLWRIANGELDGISPRKLVLLIGTNNLPAGRSTPEETLAGIDAVVTAVRAKLPTTRVLLLSIFPRGGGPSDPVMQAVVTTNAGIRDIARRYDCDHLDLGTFFTAPATDAPRPEIMPDRLHLNAAGYRIWLAALEPFLAE